MSNFVTLYKNCKLTADYFFVLDNKFAYEKNGISKTAFLHYLDTLEKVTFETNDFYLVNSSRLNIPFTGDVSEIYAYNYMKIVTDKTQDCYAEKYYFITDMVQNGFSTVTANYIEDKWSNYSDKIHIFPSYLERKKHVFNNSIYSPAVAYKSNKPFVFQPLVVKQTPKYQILISYQLYNLAQAGVATDREIGSAFLEVVGHSGLFYADTLNNVLSVVNTVMVNSSQATINDGRRYEITKIRIVPEYIHFGSSIGVNYDIIIDNITYRINKLRNTSVTTDINDLEDLYSINFNSNFKITGIGVYSYQLPININGRDKTIKIITSNYASEPKIILSVDGSLIDITDYFEYKYPVSIDNASTTQQQKISFKLNETLLQNQEKQSITDGIFSTANVVTGTLAMGGSAIAGSITGVAGSANAVVGGLKGQVDAYFSYQNAREKLNAIRSEQYTSNRSYIVNSENLINSVYGIGVSIVDSFNDNIVDGDINLNGYMLYELHNDDVFDNSNTDDVIKFSSVSTYGNVTQSILQWFNSLLTNGIRIIYNDNV